jgi:hypothetical protein
VGVNDSSVERAVVATPAAAFAESPLAECRLASVVSEMPPVVLPRVDVADEVELVIEEEFTLGLWLACALS